MLDTTLCRRPVAAARESPGAPASSTQQALDARLSQSWMLPRARAPFAGALASREWGERGAALGASEWGEALGPTDARDGGGGASPGARSLAAPSESKDLQCSWSPTRVPYPRGGGAQLRVRDLEDQDLSVGEVAGAWSRSGGGGGGESGSARGSAKRHGGRSLRSSRSARGAPR